MHRAILHLQILLNMGAFGNCMPRIGQIRVSLLVGIISGLTLLVHPSSGNYTITSNFAGASFFDGFSFFTSPDPTHGHVQFLSREDATKRGLARVDVSSGNVIMAVDSTSVSPQGRPSVRIASKTSYNAGTLFIHELTHMPVGCGTWPAYWLVGPAWPTHGEIDIIESVNNGTMGQATLHTSTNCTMHYAPGTMQGRPAMGSNGKPALDCYVKAEGEYGNQGCGVQGQDGAQGAPFNAAGGGVYATEWTSTHISSWFWPAGSAPPDVVLQPSGQPSPNPVPGSQGWGLPMARFPLGQYCAAETHFSDLSIIYDITMCGDWAGSTFAQMCPGLGTSCNDFVSNRPSAFADAYWNITRLSVYTAANSVAATAASVGTFA